MSLFFLALILAAGAQDTDAGSSERPPEIPVGAQEVPLQDDEVPDEDDDEDLGDEAGPSDEDLFTIVVVGEQDVRAARDALVRAMEDLDWKTRRRRDGRVVFRGPQPWMGKMILHPNGVVDFTTPSIAFGGTGGVGTEYEDRTRSNMDPQTGSAGMSLGFDGKRKAEAVQTEIRAATHDKLEHYRKMVRARGFARTVEALPDRLDAVWRKGEAMDGGSLSSPEERRSDILRYWASRTDTAEGRVVMRTIEVWLREEVMNSDHPVTPEEARAAEARRQDGRRLDIFPLGR